MEFSHASINAVSHSLIAALKETNCMMQVINIHELNTRAISHVRTVLCFSIAELATSSTHTQKYLVSFQSFGIFCIVQLTIMLGRRTSFDIEGRSSSNMMVTSTPEATRPKGELMPLAAAAAAVAKQKTATHALPVPIPKVPSPVSDKKYKTTATIIRKESNGNGS